MRRIIIALAIIWHATQTVQAKIIEQPLDYRHGDQRYLLEPGDSLLFDSDAPHGPEGLVELPARYLSIITYPQAR